MAAQNILREYLISLGFRVNTQEQKKFDNTLWSTGKGAAAAGLSVAGLATTIAVLAERYAQAMEKMYYASRRSGSTVTQLQAMEYAGEKVGLAAGTMTSAVTTMASKLRNNPGLIGLLGKLGVATKGRTAAQELLDLVDATKSMPYMKGSAVANLFGLDEGTYQVLRQNTAEFRAAMEERDKMDKAGGVNADANAEAMAKWGKQVTELGAEFKTLEGVLATMLLPTMEKITEETKKTLRGLEQDLQAASGFWDFVFKRGERAGKEGTAAGMPYDPDLGRVDIDVGSLFNKARRWSVGLGHEKDPGYVNRRLGPDPYAGKYADKAAAPTESSDSGFNSKAEMMAAADKLWGLTPGTMASLYNVESANGTQLTSKTGVQGPFQLTRKIQQHYAGKPTTDFEGQLNAGAEYFSDLKKQYGSDARAAAAWNGGTAAGKYGPEFGVNPQETKDFVPKFMSGINQTNNITVQSRDAAEGVKRGLAEANGDLVRNVKTVVQ